MIILTGIRTIGVGSVAILTGDSVSWIIGVTLTGIIVSVVEGSREWFW